MLKMGPKLKKEEIYARIDQILEEVIIIIVNYLFEFMALKMNSFFFFKCISFILKNAKIIKSAFTMTKKEYQEARKDVCCN